MMNTDSHTVICEDIVLCWNMLEPVILKNAVKYFHCLVALMLTCCTDSA